MFNTLYARLLAVLVCLGLTMAIIFILVIRYSDTMRRQETNQVLYRTLAAQFVDEHVLPEDAYIDYGSVQRVFDRLRVINPRLDVYLLDNAGLVLAHSGKTGVRKLDRVDLDPIQRFLRPDAQLPIRGDDPSEESRQRVFSVAPITHDGEVKGYLYLVLRGLSGDDLAERIKNSYFLRESIGLMVGGLLLALLAGAVIIKLFTQRLRRLSAVVDKFRRTEFVDPSPHPEPSLAKHGDDIDHLAQTFSQMADRISAQMRELQHNDALRRELIANVSHDLRTPLASLQGYLETLQVKSATLSDAEKSGYLDIALKQSRQLSRLTAQLFELAKLDAGQVAITIEPFVLDELVHDVVQQFELKAVGKGIRLDAVLPPELPLVAADIGLIERVLKNLIENSLRYTPSGGSISVRLAAASGHVKVEVEDTGSGIPAEDLPRVFDRFYRGEKSRADSSGNAGLGLSIAKRVLELHDSWIAVDSEPGVKTTFSFALNFVRAETPRDAADSERASAAGLLEPLAT